MASGEWRVASGEWRVASGRCWSSRSWVAGAKTAARPTCPGEAEALPGHATLRVTLPRPPDAHTPHDHTATRHSPLANVSRETFPARCDRRANR